MTSDSSLSPSGPSLAEHCIIAVVVTYNRQDLLKLTLAGIASGQMVPHRVIVVNNASDDGTADYLAQLDYPLELEIINLTKNLGGAGGFTVGIDRALYGWQADLVWVMDDDTEPTHKTLAASYTAWQRYSLSGAQAPAFVASRVVWEDGRDHPMNTMRTMFAAGARRHQRARAVGARPVRSASFVSLLMDAAVMRRVGLPLADFFIWNDDFEYSTRLAYGRDGLACPESVAIHHTKTFGTTDANPGPRFYYDVRNKLWVFFRRRSLSPLEKLLYGGSTARLWASTLLRTRDKKTYLAYLGRGLRHALRPPRSNTAVLQGVYSLESEQLAQSLAAQAGQQDPEFSVLMSVYSQDQPEFLQRALASNTLEQTRAPQQLVLVKDGPLGAELERVISDWQQRLAQQSQIELTLVTLEQNLGLAQALNHGLAACRHNIVVRADADDISLPERFASQVGILAGSELAVLGAAMYEVDEGDSRIEATRHPLEGDAAIKKVLAARNPIFHPTVVFKKSAVQAVGGYEEVPGAEDYWLWTRMAQAGFSFRNLPEPLVKYRTGAGVYSRRGGWAAFKKDLQLQGCLYRGQAFGAVQLAYNLGLRCLYRAVPQPLRQKSFRFLIGARKQPSQSSTHSVAAKGK